MAQLYQFRSDALAFDPCCRFVRFKCLRADGFVEFDFSIGEPAMAVELMLPVAQYHEFCCANKVIHVTPAQADVIDREKLQASGLGERGDQSEA